MAELSIKATLQGAAEAQAGLAGLAAATKNLGTTNEQWATIQANLNRLGEEYRAGLATRTAATQRLKDHTAELVSKILEQERAEQGARSMANQLTGSIRDMAVRFAATTFGIAAFGATLIKAFNAGREAELTMVKLRASLEATGGTVGKTAQQLEEMSESLAKGTRFDNTGIQQAMQVLLTFDNVQGDVFEGAIRHAQNLSEKFGIDLSSAARLLGRALQEPGEGIQALSRYIGTLNPALVKNIQSLNEQGRTAEAQAELIKLLDGRMKDFATTIGESAPASFDKMMKAWRNLLEEMGKTQGAEGFFAFVEERLDNVAGFFKNWTLIMRGISIDRDLKFLNEASTTAEQRVVIQKRLNETLTKLNEEADAEAQRRRDAELASKVKQWEEEAIKKKSFAEKQLKENEELTKKILADEEQATRARIELMNLELAQGKITLESKVQLIDEEMAFVAQGTATWIALSKERLSALDEIDKRENANIKRVLDRYDLDIKAGKATFAQKILFIDSQLAREKENTDEWIVLMKARQQTEDEALRQKKQTEAEIQKALQKTQRSYAELADEEIDTIRKTVFATEDLRIAALERLADAFQHIGPEASDAYDRVRKALRSTETEAERTTKRLQEAFGRTQFDLINVGQSLQSSWQGTFQEMIKGTTTFSEGIKALWKGIVDAVIAEIARMVAQWLAAQAIMGFAKLALGIGLAPATGGLSLMFAGGLASGGERIITSPTTLVVGEGGVALSGVRGFRDGGEGVFTHPTMFRAGESGPERVRVTPLAGGAMSDAGGARITNVFMGPNVMDAFSLRRFVREQERLITSEMRRRG